MNHELPDVQAGIRKGRRTRDQISNIRWIIEKAREFQKNIYFCFIDYTKAFDYVDHNKLRKICKNMGIRDHFSCLLRNLCAGQEATIRVRHGTTDWFPGIKIAGRNVNNLRYADDTTLMAESEEELKSLLMKVKEESEKVGLNFNIRKLRSWHLVPSLHGK